MVGVGVGVFEGVVLQLLNEGRRTASLRCRLGGGAILSEGATTA